MLLVACAFQAVYAGYGGLFANMFVNNGIENRNKEQTGPNPCGSQRQYESRVLLYSAHDVTQQLDEHF